ncbi:MAG: putative quinone oxidoreductase YhfP [Lysobacteraceae bacterium]|nr:MAG: putative quinone oxidoreductase YhfP [Xanthomonadaceae bacterium]
MASAVPKKFNAYRIDQRDDGHRSGLEKISLKDLNEGEVVIKTAYSSVNYKDALAGTGKGRILRRFPLVGGIDIAGHVVSSKDKRFKEGDSVLVTGSDLSENRDGGYAEYQRLDARWVVPLPKGLSLREAMGIGTAGFTAALSLWRMEQLGQTPDAGPIVVTGATGGVGMLAIDLLTQAGYDAHAITGKVAEFEFLTSIGARQCISRHDLVWGEKPLESAHWAGAIDNVGGDMLSGLTRVIKPWGNIASCGLAGGAGLRSTVMPFIIRGVSLIGINSSGCPYTIRQDLWDRLAKDWKPAHLDRIITNEIKLDELEATFDKMMAGKSFGRTVVKIGI